MSYIKKALRAVSTGDFGKLFRGLGRLIGKCLYRIRARIEDWRIGRISIDKIKPSKFRELGAKATESTNYDWLDQMFKAYPVDKNGNFLDIGCGEGRVLTYLYLRGFRGKLTGIELDPEIAETAKKRTRKCANITIINSNFLECSESIENANAIYLFNPFQKEILQQFIQMLERSAKRPVLLYYCNDIYREELDKRQGWYILRRNVLKSIASPKRSYTVYGFLPQEQEEKNEEE